MSTALPHMRDVTCPARSSKNLTKDQLTQLDFYDLIFSHDSFNQLRRLPGLQHLCVIEAKSFFSDESPINMP